MISPSIAISRLIQSILSGVDGWNSLTAAATGPAVSNTAGLKLVALCCLGAPDPVAKPSKLGSPAPRAGVEQPTLLPAVATAAAELGSVVARTGLEVDEVPFTLFELGRVLGGIEGGSAKGVVGAAADLGRVDAVGDIGIVDVHDA